MNGIEFSYNQFLDSAIGMKLFKTEIIFNSLYNSKPATEIGIPRILREEMKEIKVKDPALIKALCER